MKLIGSLTLIWTLCRTAEALSCYNCTDPICSSPEKQTCYSSELMCMTASIRVDSASGEQELIYKGCESSMCLSSGNTTFSLSTGEVTIVGSALCCNTSNCNNPTLPGPAPPVPNTLQCFSCDPADCREVSCSGEESQCFTSTLNIDNHTYPFLGCMTQNLCDADLGRLFQEDGVPLHFSRLSCCGTSLCNNPPLLPAPPMPPVRPTQTSGGSGVKLELLQLLLGLLVCALINHKSMQGW
ncbi:phospholipase A2 inhibitor subunit gamma B-like [Poecilia formosa]|uniref:phospholipase A2 inhibitor subunit gamma B-like n=1 Tax=Poecilia formosa TaxID=48698 RepID=UPI0007B9472F|nr:PREDICTED: phospholipase A2 inhibitor subunit gamma B-like [Poecilia formosa]